MLTHVSDQTRTVLDRLHTPPAVRGRNGGDERSEEQSEGRRTGRRPLLLGKPTKSASTPADTELSALSLHSQRSRRFKLQETAGEIVGGRLAYCGRRRRKGCADVKIMMGDTGAYASGVQRCGSVHSCPVCAARIAQNRRMEAITALASWRSEGGCVSMLTLTLPHHAGQSLATVLGALTSCTRYLNSGRSSMANLLAPYGYHGQIRALEVTAGGSGWHPHLHVLVFTRQLVPLDLVEVLKSRWESAAVAASWAAPNWRVGATWQDGQHAAAYVNKAGTWGMAEEVTMSASKKGGNGGRSPFELLLDAALGCDSSAALFAEYGAALHGKRQQFWSRGLKAYFGLDEKTDEEIADSEDSPLIAVEPIAVVCADSWRLVVKYSERAEVLRAAEAAGQLGVDAVCSWLFERYLLEIRRNV